MPNPKLVVTQAFQSYQISAQPPVERIGTRAQGQTPWTMPPSTLLKLAPGEELAVETQVGR